MINTLIKWSILQEDIIILKVYTLHKRMSRYEAKLTELQGEIDESSILVKYFNSPLSEMDRCNGQNISRIHHS